MGRRRIAKLKGAAPAPGDPNTPYFPDDTDLRTLSQAVLEAEMARLGKLVSADKETQRQYTAFGQDRDRDRSASTLTEKLKDAQGARDRARELQAQREEAYGRASMRLWRNIGAGGTLRAADGAAGPSSGTPKNLLLGRPRR